LYANAKMSDNGRGHWGVAVD